MAGDKKKTQTSFVGHLEGFFETGTEGVVWCLYEDVKTGYEGLKEIEEGDHLKVWDPITGRSVFDERIHYDHKIGYQPYPMNPKLGQQCALGMWVHGIQSGWDPDEWARLFFREENETIFRAELTRKPSREKRGKMVKRSKK